MDKTNYKKIQPVSQGSFDKQGDQWMAVELFDSVITDGKKILYFFMPTPNTSLDFTIQIFIFGPISLNQNHCLNP